MMVDPNILEAAYGPRDPWDRLDLRARCEAVIGPMCDKHWRRLAESAKSAGSQFLYKPPHPAKGRERIEKLHVAAVACLAALRAITENPVPETIPLGETPAELKLADELNDALLDAGEFSIGEGEILAETSRLLAIVRTATSASRAGMRLPGHGKGKETTGYAEFLDACRDAWQATRGGAKGFSTTSGRGSGPFVNFVFAAECLLPLNMRRRSIERVGDAVVRRFGR